MLFDIHRSTWDSDLLEMLDLPALLLPAVHPSSDAFGETDSEWFGEPIRIGGIAGDQQSALFGQACFTEGLAKSTYGTGCFMLMHCGPQARNSAAGLVTTRAAQPTDTPHPGGASVGAHPEADAEACASLMR